jgi:hypothetical protein
VVGVRFSRTDSGELTASCETAGGLSKQYEGAEALALSEALQAVCCHATAAESARRHAAGQASTSPTRWDEAEILRWPAWRQE